MNSAQALERAEAGLAHLTERFRRLGERSGSGLGLSVTATIVTHLGGQLHFANGEPRGLVATLSLPQA